MATQSRKNLGIRATPPEHRCFHAAAKIAGMSVHAFVLRSAALAAQALLGEDVSAREHMQLKLVSVNGNIRPLKLRRR